MAVLRRVGGKSFRIRKSICVVGTRRSTCCWTSTFSSKIFLWAEQSFKQTSMVAADFWRCSSRKFRQNSFACWFVKFFIGSIGSRLTQREEVNWNRVKTINVGNRFVEQRFLSKERDAPSFVFFFFSQRHDFIDWSTEKIFSLSHLSSWIMYILSILFKKKSRKITFLFLIIETRINNALTQILIDKKIAFGSNFSLCFSFGQIFEIEREKVFNLIVVFFHQMETNLIDFIL